MIRTFKETPSFTAKVESLGDDQLLKDIQEAILENPDVGKTVAGTGGLKKFRIADPSRAKGKRSGLRVIYLDLPDRDITYLLLLYGKNEADDLTIEEKKILKVLVSEIKGEKK
jgi:hypothetical protein